MCGIAGFSGDFSPDLLVRMGEKIAHRGPDDRDEKHFSTDDHQVGLAHRRLSIIDLTDEGRQPMTTTCVCCHAGKGKLWLIFNGEIYNYRELRYELIEKGHQFTSGTDSEVLLHAYAEFGTNFLEKLNGIFAFALYEGRANQGCREHLKYLQTGDLFLARDGLGVKPLYYSKQTNGFLFASEIKALLAYKELKREIDYAAIHFYLAYLWCPGQQTAMQAVQKILPGQAMIVRQGNILSQWIFYDIPYIETYEAAKEKDLQAELDRLLTQAVRRQLISDVPLGAFLSGGLDSSAIVAAMRKINPQSKINCYTIAFAEGMHSEGNPNDLPYAQAVAKHLHVDLHVIMAEENMFQHLQKMIYHLDEPQADPAPIHVYLISKLARQQGIKVLLSGAGGDDIFSGYRRHQALHMEQFWQWLPQPVKVKAAYFSQQLLLGKYNQPYLHRPVVRRLAHLFSYAHLPEDSRLAHYFIWNTEACRRALYGEAMYDATKNMVSIAPLLNTLGHLSHEKRKLNRMLYLETKHFLPDHNLNYTDKMSMAAGIEVRVPLLDPDLIQFAARLPVHLKQKRMVGKYIFKKSMKPYLPKSIIYRPKAGFGAPLRKWVHTGMSEMIETVLSDTAIKNRGLFNPHAVRALRLKNKQGTVDAAYTIFSILCIELWCQQFIDKPFL